VTTLTNEVINVEGMSCDHCKHSIEKALNGLDGVTSSEVSLANGNVEVEFDEKDNQVAFNDFKEAIEDQGYDVIK
jgi:copper chaperone